MKSIGDFAINIIPNIDTIKLQTGITALDSMTNIGSKVWDAFKRVYDMVDNTADRLTDLNYAARSLHMPIEQIDHIQRTMKLFNLDSNQAVEALKSIAKFRTGAKYGEFDEKLIMKAGLLPSSFGNDPIANLVMLNKLYQSDPNNYNRRAAISALVPGWEPMLSAKPEYLEKMVQKSMQYGLVHDRDLKGVAEYEVKKGMLSILTEQLKIEVLKISIDRLSSGIENFTSLLATMFGLGTEEEAKKTIGIVSKADTAFGGNAANAGMSLLHSFSPKVEIVPQINITNKSDGTSIKTEINSSKNSDIKDTIRNTEANKKVSM